MVGAVSVELALNEIGSLPSDAAFVGAILLRPDQRLQSHLHHPTLHRLVIDDMTEPAQCSSHPAITVAALVVVEDGSDLLLETSMAVDAGRLLSIVERAAGKPCQFEQTIERIEQP